MIIKAVLCGMFFTWSQFALAGPSYFPGNYAESKNAFLKTDPELLLNFKSHHVSGTLNNELTVDLLQADSHNATQAIILVSGTHGAEAPAGVALQKLFRDRWLKRFLAKKISIYMIHALNPYGFATGRRVTENNIDLNRNFIFGTEDRPANPEFSRLRSSFIPKEKLGSNLSASSWLSFFNISRGLLGELFFGKLTRDGIANAVAGGQFEFQDSLFYGGQKPEPQTIWFEQFFRETLAKYSRLIVLDVHTGLGEKGVLHIMPADQGIKDKASDLYARLEQELASENKIKITPSTSKGFYNTQGGFSEYCVRSGQGRALAFTLEYGTYSTGLWAQLWSLAWMSRENQLALLGSASADASKEVMSDFANLFNPADEAWQKQVLDSADKFFEILEKSL